MTPRRCARSKVLALLVYGNLRNTDSFRSYRADIILMLNRGIRRLVVSLEQFPQTATLAHGFSRSASMRFVHITENWPMGTCFIVSTHYGRTNTLVGF